MGFFQKLFGREELTLRQPRFAGLLYPEDKAELREQVRLLLERADSVAPVDIPDAATMRALIVPQAEYEFAGSIMAAGWAMLHDEADRFERVVLVGSSRLVPFRGLAVTGYDGFETPLGPLPFDKEAIETLARLEQVRPIEPAFDPEASLEAQLPFVREVFKEVTIVPLLVGDATDEQVEEALAGFIGDPNTLVVVSANLSHDVAIERADVLDEETVRAIEALDPEPLGREHSAGRAAIRGLICAARARGLACHTIARQTSSAASGATSGPVTGYGAFGFFDVG